MTYSSGLSGFAGSLTAPQQQQVQSNPNVVMAMPDPVVSAGIAHPTPYKAAANSPPAAETGINGYTIVKGAGTITAGTGSWQRAQGSFKLSGESPPGAAYFLLKFTGKVVK
jgi:hypothetical protein